MQIFRHHTQIPDGARGAVVAIGNFDGIHRGHQTLIGQAAALARQLNAPLAVMTFEPHPRMFFQPNQPPFRLTSFRVKSRLLESLGVDLLFNLAFNHELAGLSAEDFVRDVLVTNLGACHVVVGDNFRFGNKRKGDIALLKQLGDELGLGVTTLARVTSPGDEPYSSSLVRDYLADGNPTRAGLLLGRYWEIEGRVQQGAKRGRDLGFPTANMALGDSLRPAYGVYAVRAALEEGDGSSHRWMPGVANLGISPMFSYDEPLLETYLFDFDQDIYGRHLRVALVDYLRPEANFRGLDELVAQIRKDCDKARATLSWEVWDQEWPVSPFISGKM